MLKNGFHSIFLIKDDYYGENYLYDLVMMLDTMILML